MYVFTNHLELSTVIDTLHLLSNKCCRVDWNYQWSLCALHSTCVWAARCLKLNKPLITALNTGVENWASLQPNPRLQVLDTACCVFLFRSLTCADARVHVCMRMNASDREKTKSTFVFVREWVQTTPFEASVAVRWGLGTDTLSLCWLAGNSISHIRAATHALFIPQSHKRTLSHLYSYI